MDRLLSFVEKQRGRTFKAWLKEHPPLLDVTLESGFRVVTFQQARGAWESMVHHPAKRRGLSALRKAATEEEARANHAALCGEFGP